MNRDQLKDHLRKRDFVRKLPPEEQRIAYAIIDKGADVALLLFWYHLRELSYWRSLRSVDVAMQALYFMSRNPDFEDDIAEWFNLYDKKIRSLYGGPTNHSKRGTT